MRLLFLTTGLFFGILTAYGQYGENLVSDRPGQSISPNTVGKNIFQIQAGYTFDRSERNVPGLFMGAGSNPTLRTTNNNGNAKVRYGITERFEASVQGTLGRTESYYLNEDFIAVDDGIQLLGIAVRGNLLTTENGKFALGAELESRFAPDEENDLAYDNFLLTFSGALSITEKLSATANAGAFFEDESQLFFTANLGYAAFEKAGAFVEFYPIIDDFEWSQAYLNTGLYFAVAPDFVFDLAGSFLVSDARRTDTVESTGFNIQAGLTYRLGKHKE